MIARIRAELESSLPPFVTNPVRKQMRLIKELCLFPRYFSQFLRFRSVAATQERDITARIRDIDVHVGDGTSTTPFDHHYIYHPAWAARILAQTRPDEHIDISSTLHFCSLVSAFVKVKFYDYRPAPIHLSNLQCCHADLTQLPFADGSIASLSCMHTVEHVGLGRYGDPLDPQGDERAISELTRVLAVRGDLLFVVPIGRPKVVFNAHRIYSYDQVLQSFPTLRLQQFALVPDAGHVVDFVVDATKEMANQQAYGCGCFWFKK